MEQHRKLKQRNPGGICGFGNKMGRGSLQSPALQVRGEQVRTRGPCFGVQVSRPRCICFPGLEVLRLRPRGLPVALCVP